jgi:hypothetical protein
MEAGSPSTPRTPYSSFSANEFRKTSSWERLANILTGNGGAYGLYGPRGSGKSWLMLQAIHQANEIGGIGLWFPCPSDYETTAFLSALSDNVASEVERRFIRDGVRPDYARGAPIVLAGLAVVLFVAQLTSSVIHGGLSLESLFSLRTLWVWVVLGVVLGTLAFTRFGQTRAVNMPGSQLAREATDLRERIRYSTALKMASEASISSGATARLGASLRQTQERSLNERPTTIASLVFDFRRLAARIVSTTGMPVVIGIDELDKIEDPEAVRRLLRDIKGIFEISGVFFLVSVSEEAATTLQLGPLQGKGRNEFNSSFYTVIELKPLSPDDISYMMRDRDMPLTDQCAQLLCLLSAGNWREMIRQEENYLALKEARDDTGHAVEFRLAMAILRAEATALQRDIIRLHSGAEADEANQVLSEVWRALPSAAFKSPHAFTALSQSAINAFWTLPVTTKTWEDAISESWCRFLIRLFVVGKALSAMRLAGGTPTIDASGICDLRDVLVMASHSASVAKLMLQDRCGHDLAGPYHKPPA